ALACSEITANLCPRYTRRRVALVYPRHVRYSCRRSRSTELSEREKDLTQMSLSTRRPPQGERRFVSPAVEATIERVQAQIRDRELAWLFANCFPNTLDTTVTLATDARGRDDTFVITGDIDAMWLRDSTAQVWPYLPLLREDGGLRQLVAGVINRQVACVLLDPYANAFLPSVHPLSQWQTDQTATRHGV